MSASAAPAPDRAALLDCALACPVCSESFRRTHSLCCAQFTSGPFHREAHRSLGGGARKASTTARGANARTAGAPASASIPASGAGATTSGAPASSSTTARGVNARTAGAPASASITARGVDDVFCQLRNYAAADGRVAPRRCSCGRRCQRAWASRCCSGGQGPRAAALAWLEGQARRGFSLKLAHGARVEARRPHAWCARARRRQASSLGCRLARGDKWALWAVISVAALVGIRSEDTAVGRALSGAVVSKRRRVWRCWASCRRRRTF